MASLSGSGPGKSRRWLAGCLALDVALTYVFLYLPIIVLVVYGFSASRYATVWGGFSLEWYGKLLENRGLAGAVANSLAVAALSTLVATVLGTLLAFALERSRFRGKRAVETLALLPILIPEIVMAIGLLIFFARFFRPFLQGLGMEFGSFPAVVAGHVTIGMSYAMVVVRARLKDLDPTLEEAAMDLGASRWQVFLRITLPLLLPAIVSGALLAFTLSLDDFYVTYFATTGGSGFKTLPLYIYALQGRSGVTPEMNAISTLMLCAPLTLVALAMLLQRKKT